MSSYCGREAKRGASPTLHPLLHRTRGPRGPLLAEVLKPLIQRYSIIIDTLGAPVVMKGVVALLTVKQQYARGEVLEQKLHV